MLGKRGLFECNYPALLKILPQKIRGTAGLLLPNQSHNTLELV